MKTLAIILLFSAFAFTGKAQTASKKSTADQEITKQIVNIACGECQFKMKGKSCDLAIRIDGKSYFVDGKNIDDFGDAHGKHGFCNAVSKAEVSGKIVNNRFKASNIRLLSK
ncbi:DUF6370 family protein [Pedobacter agri]|uniref:DUF6370 family protein n=1 Tax=Pedobacter agri TaxID=454586 RepID=UPI00292D7733|nr:DUF6370 family protein [Pedobacter agri]